MDLRQVAAVIRPRGYAEAVDLGFHMARRWWRPIVGSWLAATLPLLVVPAVLLRGRPMLVLLIIWWLKPLLARIPLFVVSRGLFGALPNVRDTLRALPSMLGPDLFLDLTFLRLSPIRSVVLPVSQLEGQRGAARRQRSRLLAKGVHFEAARLLGICALFELNLWITQAAFILMMIPDPDLDRWFDPTGSLLLPLYARWILVALYFVAVTVVEPFYVAAGFALYLNRRTLLEAWDIEVAFRAMAGRIGSSAERPSAGFRAVSTLLLAFLAAGAALQPVRAAEATPADAPANVEEQTRPLADGALQPSAVVQEVLADEEFGGSRMVTGWRFKGGQAEEFQQHQPPFRFGGFLAAILEPLFWLTVAGAAALLIVQIVRRVRWRGGKRKTERAPPPEVVLGLDVREESLPRDVVSAARKLWSDGKTNESIRLLYRGALSRLILRDGLSVTGSATEGDCLRKAATLIPDDRYGYFRALTRVWQSTSYGHRPPDADQAATLFDQWGPHFGVST